MAKSLLNALNGIVEAFDSEMTSFSSVVSNPEELSFVEDYTNVVCPVLDITPMQAFLLAIFIERSTSRRTSYLADIAKYLGMSYLKLLTLMDDIQVLRDKWYIRMDSENNITIPASVIQSLMKNEPYKKPEITGLSTNAIMLRIKDLLNMVKKEEIDDEIAFRDIAEILRNNLESCFTKTTYKYLTDFKDDREIYMYFILMSMIFSSKLEEFTMATIEDYFSDLSNWELLVGWFGDDLLDLQRSNIIERVSEDGLVSPEKFKVKDEIVNAAFADVKGWSLSNDKTIQLIDCSQKPLKNLYYNSKEQQQVERLEKLLDVERLNGVYESMKAKGMRLGFTCLFYGAPGTGKTETVYQLARKTGRKILEADVAQLKNCWVGETEKNARRLFRQYRRACEENELTPILLFNEADAIFGVRMEGAQRAVDKMENSVQNIILQEMEQFEGILIATTNLTKNLDAAFERRFLYKICFGKPNQVARTKIWQSMIPDICEEEASQLASSFDFSGGQIENVVRKRTVDAILYGETPGYESIVDYCKEETLSDNKGERRKIGFV